MAQRLTQSRQIYCIAEVTEGVDPGTIAGTNAIVVTNLTVNGDRAFLPRQLVGQLGNYTGKMGVQTDPGLSFSMELRPGVGSTNVPAADALLASVLSAKHTDTGSTTISGTGSTSTSLNVVSATNFSAGNAIAVETATAGVYEVSWISPTWGGSSPITLSQALTFTPNVNGKNVKSSTTYKPQNSGHGSLTFYVSLDGSGGTDMLVFVGCKGTCKVDVAAPGAIPNLTFNFKAMAWYYQSVGALTPTYDATAAQQSYLYKIDGTATNVKLTNWDLGQSVARKMTQNATLTGNASNYGTFAQVVANRSLKGSMQAYDVDDSAFTSWSAGTVNALSQQFGSAVNAMAAYQIPAAQRVKVGYGDDNGLTTDQVDFQGNFVSGADEVRLAFC